MKIWRAVFVFLSFLKVCVDADSLWYSYHYESTHKNREEFVITNITSEDSFHISHPVEKWKSLRNEDRYYLAGVLETKVVIVTMKMDLEERRFLQNSSVIETGEAIVDFHLFQHICLQNSSIIVLIATKESNLLWYKVTDETNITLFWSWPVAKNISHVNVFQIGQEYHLLIIKKYLTQITADLYLFQLNGPPNFWFRQKLELTSFASSSAGFPAGPDYFLAIPQKSLNLVMIYKFTEDRFVLYKNLSSRGVSEVVAFKIGHLRFLAINGLQAGIYKYTKKNFIRENIVESHSDGVNHWLPIPLTVYGDDMVLMAQRSLLHEPHKSFVIEIITYNGEKFEEHDDISCSYFGDNVLGLSCLPDEEKGIVGATSIFLNDALALLVPRKNRSSELFLFRWELKKIPDPLLKQIADYVEKKNYIKDLLQEQEEKYNELSKRPSEMFNSAVLTAQLDEIDNGLKNLQATKLPQYDTIVFNGLVKIETRADFGDIQTEKINGELTTATFEDLALKNNLSLIPSSKIFNELQVEDLLLEKVNGIDSSNLLFATRNLTINGNLLFEKPLVVLENSTVENMGEALNKLETNNLFIPGNIEVNTVNGENFTGLLWEICLKNIKNKVPGILEIKGDVAITENAEIKFLNDLSFPNEYVFAQNTFPNITGRKYFLGTVSTDEIKTEGTIDEIDTSKIITLEANQNITGVTTFKHLKITESLNVYGNIIGEHASKFLPNPTLFEKNSIEAKVNFKQLDVEGAIILSDNFNGQHLESLLNDIVYNNEEMAIIDAVKEFPEALTVRKHLTIDSEMINNVPINSIITKNTEQILNVTTINGVVTFGNVELDGLYDNVDIDKLDEDVVKLDGEQYISSTLIFEDHIHVNRLELLKNVNLMPVLNESASDEMMEVDTVVVEGNFYGDIDDFDLKNFAANRMCLSEDQSVESNFVFGNVFSRHILPTKINNIDAESFTETAIRSKMVNKLLRGNLSVTNFYANSLQVDKLDNKSIIGFGGSLWKHDIKQHNLTNLSFNDNVYFDHINIEKLSGVNFNKYVENIVFKNETDVKISGTKSFLKGCTVKKLIETQRLNNIFLENILTKYGNQEISGPIIINNDVTFKSDLTVVENLNNIPVNAIVDSHEISKGQITIKGDVLFNRLAHIHNLQIQGYVDDRMVQDVVDGIVYTDEHIKLEGEITFENCVNIEKNVRVIGKINNIDLAALVSDMVMISKDADIQGPVKFRDEVWINNSLIVNEGLKTNTINGIRTQDWVNNAIFINRGYLKGNYMFEEVSIVDSLRAEYLADINLKTLIPLRTEQNLTRLRFAEVSLLEDVRVGNSTNYRNLTEEFDNSVLANADQDIDSDVEFLGNVYVEGDLELSGLVNGAGTNHVVTTNTDQELRAVYNFKIKTNFEEGLIVEGLINGINFTEWSLQTVRRGSKFTQNVSDHWSVEKDLVLEEDSAGNGLINGVNFEEFLRDIEDKRSFKYQSEKAFIDDYTNICKDLTFMYGKLKKQIYKFRYFENLQVLNFQRRVNYVHNYNYKNDDYLLISEESNCETYLFIFKDNRFKFVKSIHFGLLEQIIFVHYNDLMYFVVRNRPFYSTCKVQRTNVWRMIDNDFVHTAKLQDQDLLQESLVAGTFYGKSGNTVTEFKILPNLDSTIRRYRKWEINDENVAFVPRGFGTGLALRTGRKLIRLTTRQDAITEDFGYETEKIIIGNYTEESNTCFPGRKDSDLVVMRVGIKSNKRSLLGVATREETSVKGGLDFIKIYEDVITGKVFHKVPTYKPASLASLDFNNGETLLVFMEDESVFKVYEYKGIEGFRHKLSVRLKGSKLFAFDVTQTASKKIIGVVDRRKITFMEAVMLGNQIADDLQCNL